MNISQGHKEVHIHTHTPHLLSATVRVYSLVAPCRLPDLTSLALLGSISGQPGLSRGPLPGYKRVSKWRLHLQDSTPFLLLSQRFCTTLHTSASLGCYLLFTLMPDCPLAPLFVLFFVFVAKHIVVGRLIVQHTSNTITCSHSFILHSVYKIK